MTLPRASREANTSISEGLRTHRAPTPSLHKSCREAVSFVTSEGNLSLVFLVSSLRRYYLLNHIFELVVDGQAAGHLRLRELPLIYRQSPTNALWFPGDITSDTPTRQ